MCRWQNERLPAAWSENSDGTGAIKRQRRSCGQRRVCRSAQQHTATGATDRLNSRTNQWQGSQPRQRSQRLVKITKRDLHERTNHGGVEMVACAGHQVGASRLGGHRLLIGASCSHHFEGVGNSHDPSAQGDVFGGDAVRLAGPVVAFVVLIHGVDPPKAGEPAVRIGPDRPASAHAAVCL